MSDTIVIVEDDDGIRQLLEVALKSGGWEPLGFRNAADALAAMRSRPPSAAIFDIMMQGMDGVTAVKLMRQSPRLRDVPVIMLTAKDTESDKIAGLDAGADDYMTKPFSVLELCARVRALLRRAREKGGEVPAVFESGGLRLDTALREVTLRGAPIELTYKEFELLKVLMESPDRVLPRTELLARVWGEDYCGETRTLDIHVGTLRQKLRDADGRFIRTVRGVGYRFAGGASE